MKANATAVRQPRQRNVVWEPDSHPTEGFWNQTSINYLNVMLLAGAIHTLHSCEWYFFGDQNVTCIQLSPTYTIN